MERLSMPPASALQALRIAVFRNGARQEFSSNYGKQVWKNIGKPGELTDPGYP